MDLIQQTIELIGAFGVAASLIKLNDAEKNIYDKGLRFSLYKDFDYLYDIRKMDEFYQNNTIYIVKDSFEEHYMSMRLPDGYMGAEVPQFLHIGPYLLRETEEILELVIEKNGLPMTAMRELKEYFGGIPHVKERDILESIVITQAGYIFGAKDKIEINRINNLYGRELTYQEVLDEIGDKLSYSAIEERYGYEQELIKAIGEGNLERALEWNNKFTQFGLDGDYGENIRKSKNIMIVLNTLFRKAVQEANIHPAHIDGLSGNFSKQIEACSSIEDLRILNKEMIRKYCIMVRNHSLQGYSITVRNAINYIDFHIRDSLALKDLANAINVNASYLSNQFKKETGKTLTDYVNEKRIHNSRIFIATTDMSIQSIAELVGIYDVNYYSRLFKKFMGRTAMQYRNMMRPK